MLTDVHLVDEVFQNGISARYDGSDWLFNGDGTAIIIYNSRVFVSWPRLGETHIPGCMADHRASRRST